MASGGDANWRVARDEGLQRILLGILCKWLEAQDMGEKDGIGRPTRRTETARIRGAGDPDTEFRHDAEEGQASDTRCQGLRMSLKSSHAGLWTISPRKR